MPIFEYRCSDCEREFEAFVTGARAAACPACRSVNLVKQLSSPGMVGAAQGAPARMAGPATGGCGAGGAHCACRSQGH